MKDIRTDIAREIGNRFFTLKSDIWGRIAFLAKRYRNDSYLISKSPKVTVYTPTHNRAATLIDRAVESVLEQSYTNFEYLIIGDCCTDNTAELVKGINDSRINFYNLQYSKTKEIQTPENAWLAGEVKAANYALSKSKGQWIARIDDDDIWTRDHLETLITFASEGNYEFVSANSEATRYGKEIVEVGPQAYSDYFKTTGCSRKLKGNPIIGAHSTWVHRDYLKHFRYNPYCWSKNHNRVNDADLVVRFIRCGVRIGHLPKVMVYQYPRRGESTVGFDVIREKLGSSVEI